MEYISFLFSLIGFVVAWLYGTKKKRLLKAIKEQQEKIKNLEDYVASTGYKLILRDCFHIFSYSFSIVFIFSGLCLTLTSLVSEPALRLFFIQFTSAVILAAGVILFELFWVLSKTFKPEKHIENMHKKLEHLKSEHENT